MVLGVTKMNAKTQLDINGANIKEFYFDSEIDPKAYDNCVVAFSGGKDSLCCILHLLELGVKSNHIEIWHHDIDAGNDLMDWPCTPKYVRNVASALHIPAFFSWRVGGFKSELLKENTRSLPVQFESPSGLITTGGKKGKISTRLKFPQVSLDLMVRWCTLLLKMDLSDASFNNQARFHGKRTLLITGERAEESKARAKKPTFKIHKCDHRDGEMKRHIDVWRPVHSWSRGEIWELIEKWKINPHPCYRLGWGRCSCAACIFSNPNQYASLKIACPEKFNEILRLEMAFGCSIKRDKYIGDFIKSGVPYKMEIADIHAINNKNIDEPVFVKEWKTPLGATTELDGPC